MLWLLPWVLGAIAFVLILCSEAHEKGWISAAVYAGVVLGLQWAGTVDTWGYVTANVGAVLLYALLYLVLGVLWATFKWYLFVLNEAAQYEKKKSGFFNNHNSHLPENLKNDPGLSYAYKATLWQKEMAHSYQFPPKIQRHWDKIVHWIGHWVTSLLWTLLSDFLTKICRWCGQMFSGVFQSISDKIFAKYKLDFKEQK